jgi:sirohydrochlorin ferrochelatase
MVRNVRALRPSVAITLGFVDVLLPTVEDVLDSVRGTTVLVPALLSSGYHVSADIPRAVRRRRGAAITRHLGPDPLLTRALADGLAAARGGGEPGPVALVSAGSSDPAARTELDAAAADLSSLLGVIVRATSLGDSALDLAGVEVASYLLAEGTMSDAIAARATAAGAAVVAGPIGAHPAVAELIVRRYGEGLSA